MPFLRDRAAVAESQPLSQNRGDCGLFSTDDLATLTLFLLVCSTLQRLRMVRLTAGVPALTSRAGASLSFLFPTPPAAPTCSWSSRSQSGSSEHTGAPFHSGGVRSPLTVSVCSIAGALRKSAGSPVQVATASQRPNAVAPSPFCLSSDICVRFHGSPLRTSILSAGDVHLYRIFLTQAGSPASDKWLRLPIIMMPAP